MNFLLRSANQKIKKSFKKLQNISSVHQASNSPAVLERVFVQAKKKLVSKNNTEIYSLFFCELLNAEFQTSNFKLDVFRNF